MAHPVIICISFLLLLLGAEAGSNAVHFAPSGVRVGTSLSVNTDTFHPFQLNAANPLATVDFSVERAGVPFFSVSSLRNGPAQVEVKYSESFDSLSQPMSDGPYPFALSLSNCFRVETFNVTKPGFVSSPLLQGGQRWMSLRLLTNNTVDINTVGFVATTDTTDIDRTPGYFRSDDDQLNQIWKLGARASQLSCVERGSQPPIWNISDMGALVRSVRPSQSLSCSMHADYTLEFDAMIKRGGIWWNVAFPLGANSGYQLMLTSELPEGSTFANTDRTMTPPNTIRLASGYAFVNQTTLPSNSIGTYDVPFSVKENEWYRIKTSLTSSGEMSVSINGTNIFTNTLGGFLYGSFGFGAWQDQEAYVRNVTVRDTQNQTLLCGFNMTDDSVLAEFGTQSNLESVCLDGPKRDRLVWAGDFYHTCRIVGVSTSRFDLTGGTLDFISRTQIPNGDFNTAPVMSYDPAVQGPYLDSSGDVGQQDYEVLAILAYTQYVAQTADVGFVKATWSRWKLHAHRIISQIGADGLVHLSYGFIGPGAGGSAVSCATVEGINGMADVASLAGDDESSTYYSAVAANLSRAINARLWNDDIGAYALDVSNMDVISTSGTGLCITSGVATGNRTSRSLAAVASLAVHPAYKDNSQSSNSDKLSPFMNGFLLPAFFIGNDSASGMALIRSLWGAMQASNNTASGASWEYINPDGSPGLSYFTSLAHPWGGAATYVVTEYVAGLRRVDGAAGVGYRNWILAPDLKAGVKKVDVQVQTPAGPLSVKWRVCSHRITASIIAPKGTRGVFAIGNSSITVVGHGSTQTVSLPTN